MKGLAVFPAALYGHWKEYYVSLSASQVNYWTIIPAPNKYAPFLLGPALTDSSSAIASTLSLPLIASSFSSTSPESVQ